MNMIYKTTMSEAQNDNDSGTDHALLVDLHIQTLECPACDDVHQCVDALVDPMKSRTTKGWLRGELRAPT